VLITAVVALALAAITAHIYLSGRREDAIGALAVLDHVFDLIFALTLTATLMTVGHAVCERFRLRFFNTAEEIGVSLFVGTGVVGVSVLLIGLIGWLRPLPISLLIITCVVATRGSCTRLYKLFAERIPKLAQHRETTVVAAIYTALVLLFVVRAASPPSSADELIYHLPVPESFVEQGRVYPMFDNSLGNFPFLIHMIYALCLMVGSDIAARLFSLFLAVGTSLAIFGFCSRYLTRRVGVVAMIAFFGAGMIIEVAVTSRIDVSLAGMLFLCTYTMMNYIATKDRGWLWISALLAGFSLGIKHTAAIWLALLGCMYLVQCLIINRDRVIEVLGRGAAYALLALAIASPWYIKNYIWFHNPVYPLFTGEVAEFGPQGIRYFDANDERRLEAFFNIVRSEMPEVIKVQEQELILAINSRAQRHPLRWWEFFFKPNRYLMSEPNHYPNYLFLVIPLLVFVTRPRWIMWLLVISIGFVFAITWTSWIARYLVPAYPALTIVSGYTLVALSERLKLKLPSFKKLPLYAVAIALGVALSATAPAITVFSSPSFLTGRVSRKEAINPLTYYQPIKFINSQLPPDARILIVGAQLHYGIEREYITDESWFATKWRRVLIRNSSFEEVHQDLKQQGFTHVFFSADLFRFAALMGTEGTGGMEMIAVNKLELSDEARRLGPEYQLLRNWSTFTLYKRKYLQTVYSDEYGYQVLKIK